MGGEEMNLPLAQPGTTRSENLLQLYEASRLGSDVSRLQTLQGIVSEQRRISTAQRHTERPVETGSSSGAKEHQRHTERPVETGSSSGAKVHQVVHFIAGGIGGIGSILAGHPLDTIKVRLQTQPTKNGVPLLYKGTLDCAVKTVRNEGVRGLFKGMFVPILVVTPRCAMTFWGFNLGKSLQTPKGTNGEYAPYQLMAASQLSGFFSTLLMTPGERIKCLLQVQDITEGGVRYANSLDCAKKLYHRTGFLKGIYGGFSATLLRDLPFQGTFFMTYEIIKRSIVGPETSNSVWAVLGVLFAGGMSGVISWSVCIAFDTIKSRVQSTPAGTTPKSIRGVVAELLQKEGPKGLFRGLSPVLIRAFPANAACFGGYEMGLFVMKWFGG